MPSTAGGLGALLQGVAGGVMAGKQAQQGMAEQKQPDANATNPGTAIQAAADKPGSFGMPGTTASASPTGALGLPANAYMPNQNLMASTPDNKAAATQSTGTWGNLAGYFNTPQQAQPGPQA